MSAAEMRRAAATLRTCAAPLGPEVAEVLSDWLSAEASRRELAEQLLGSTRFMTNRDIHPLTLARLINGGKS